MVAFTAEHNMLRKLVRDFAEKEIGPHTDEWEAKGSFPAHELFTNNSITYVIVLLGAIGMTGEWRHRTITSTILASPDRVPLLFGQLRQA